MAKPGAELQQLVQLLESQLNGREGVKVQSPAYLTDKTTVKPREHDVLVTFTRGHHTTILALECRDRSRPVGVGEVEAFHTKCGDTGVNQSVIVSSKGFYSTALKKAQRYDIGCLTLTEASSLDWCKAAQLVSFGRLVPGGTLIFGFSDGVPEIPPGCTIMDEAGELSHDAITAIAVRGVGTVQREYGPDDDGKGFYADLRDDSPSIYLKTPDGRELRPARVTLRANYTVSATLKPMSFHTYRDQQAGTEITSLMTTTFEMGTTELRLAMIGRPDSEAKTISPLCLTHRFDHKMLGISSPAGVKIVGRCMG